MTFASALRLMAKKPAASGGGIAVTGTAVTAGGTSLSLPSNNSGDLIFVAQRTNGSDAFSEPTGYTSLEYSTSRQRLSYKVSSGSEASVGGLTTRTLSVAFVVSGLTGTAEGGLAPSWGADDNFFVDVEGTGDGSATGEWTLSSANGFTLLGSWDESFGSTLGIAYKLDTAASASAPTWSFSGTLAHTRSSAGTAK